MHVRVKEYYIQNDRKWSLVSIILSQNSFLHIISKHLIHAQTYLKTSSTALAKVLNNQNVFYGLQ